MTGKRGRDKHFVPLLPSECREVTRTRTKAAPRKLGELDNTEPAASKRQRAKLKEPPDEVKFIFRDPERDGRESSTRASNIGPVNVAGQLARLSTNTHIDKQGRTWVRQPGSEFWLPVNLREGEGAAQVDGPVVKVADRKPKNSELSSHWSSGSELPPRLVVRANKNIKVRTDLGGLTAGSNSADIRPEVQDITDEVTGAEVNLVPSGAEVARREVGRVRPLVSNSDPASPEVVYVCPGKVPINRDGAPVKGVTFLEPEKEKSEVKKRASPTDPSLPIIIDCRSLAEEQEDDEGEQIDVVGDEDSPPVVEKELAGPAGTKTGACKVSEVTIIEPPPLIPNKSPARPTTHLPPGVAAAAATATAVQPKSPVRVAGSQGVVATAAATVVRAPSPVRVTDLQGVAATVAAARVVAEAVFSAEKRTSDHFLRPREPNQRAARPPRPPTTAVRGPPPPQPAQPLPVSGPGIRAPPPWHDHTYGYSAIAPPPCPSSLPLHPDPTVLFPGPAGVAAFPQVPRAGGGARAGPLVTGGFRQPLQAAAGIIYSTEITREIEKCGRLIRAKQRRAGLSEKRLKKDYEFLEKLMELIAQDQPRRLCCDMASFSCPRHTLFQLPAETTRPPARQTGVTNR